MTVRAGHEQRCCKIDAERLAGDLLAVPVNGDGRFGAGRRSPDSVCPVQRVKFVLRVVDKELKGHDAFVFDEFFVHDSDVARDVIRDIRFHVIYEPRFEGQKKTERERTAENRAG